MNIYGYPYNVPGFEILFIHYVFRDKIPLELVIKYLNKQFELTYDEMSDQFGKGCYDKVTINYRIYEYYKALELRDLSFSFT